MYRVAAATLRGVGRTEEASDAVGDAIVSIMAKPPQDVRNWEAFLVRAVKRKALDRVRSARVKHAGPTFDPATHDLTAQSAEQTVLDEYELIRRAELINDGLSVLDDRSRQAVWETVALQRPRSEVARDLGVSPPRISQMRTKGLSILREHMSSKEKHDG